MSEEIKKSRRTKYGNYGNRLSIYISNEKIDLIDEIIKNNKYKSISKCLMELIELGYEIDNEK